MRIALLTDGIAPYVLGGMQKHSFYLVKYLAKNKIEVDLVHYNDSSYDINKLEFFSNEERKYINSIVLKFPISKKFPGHYVYNSYKYSCLAYQAIVSRINTYDFIYTKGFSGWKLISEKNNNNIKCCQIGVNFHGYEMFQVAPEIKSKLKQFLLRPFVKKISTQADVVFSYGGKITDIIKSIGVNEKKIIEMPSGVEKEYINNFISAHQEPYTKFIFLGRAERRKGIVELNNVLKKLLSEKVNFKFEFIGPIPEAMKVKDSSIIYHGEIRDSNKIKKILQQNDVLVCPSWSEGFPNVILEGMASGLAIIATYVGAVPTIVSDKNGWLIEASNSNKLYNAIKQTLTDKELASKKAHSLNMVNTTFNWDIISVKLIETIKSLNA